MIKNFREVLSLIRSLSKLDRQLDQVQINQGRILAALNQNMYSSELSDYEFKVFSQWGEDGILQFLTSNLKIKNKTFVEFGIETFHESNCRFLMMKDRWSGFVIDGSEQNINKLKRSYFYWQYPLNAISSFVTQENIENLLEKSNFEKDLGILSVDIDGVDWHVLQKLNLWRASIIVVEYNGIFGTEYPLTVPYDPAFQRTNAHFSNLYYGANLPAFDWLLKQREYSLVGVNSVGSNAFFVRNDLLNERVKAVAIGSCYRNSTFREGRNKYGKLSFLADSNRGKLIAHMPLLNVLTGKTITVGDVNG